MRDMGIVQGSATQAVPLVVGFDTVYVHTDIEPVPPDEERDNEGLYQYREIQYDKNEYIRLMSEKNAEVEHQLIDVQLALVELYEGRVI